MAQLSTKTFAMNMATQLAQCFIEAFIRVTYNDKQKLLLFGSMITRMKHQYPGVCAYKCVAVLLATGSPYARHR